MKTGTELRVAGIFAGIGGLELGLCQAGHHAKVFCEIDAGAVAVLKARFPGVPVQSDVTALASLPKNIDLLTAGFPCQDLSQAGMTRGIGGRQSGLIDHVFRLLRGADVPWVLLENVPFMLQLARGNAIRHVTRGLESLGYQWAYRVIDTRAFGLPQRRERVFILASKESSPAAVLFGANAEPAIASESSGVPCGFYWTEGLRGLGWAVESVPTLKGGSTIGIPSPPAIWMPDGSFVTPDIRDAERLQGFNADWTLPATESARSSHRWKLVGNAVSVPVARWIGTRLTLGRQRCPRNSQPISRLSETGTWPRAAFSFEGKAWAAEVSTWPVSKASKPLQEFLKYPLKPLSLRALEGFLSRLERSKLSRPCEFDRDLRRAIRLAHSNGDGSSAHVTARSKKRKPKQRSA
jgi:DNA (cytosine-5)-methyltransferase 1